MGRSGVGEGQIRGFVTPPVGPGVWYRAVPKNAPAAARLAPRPVTGSGSRFAPSRFLSTIVSVLPDIVVDRLIELSRTGLPRSAIAAQTGLSRSSVCAALWRRGERPVERERKPPAPRPVRRKRRAIPVATVAPQSIAVTLAEVRGCRWEVTGSKTVSDYLFCNSDRTDSGHPSYCGWHFRMSINVVAR